MSAPSPSVARWVYPPTPRGAAVDTYFGRAIADPYAHLEDPEAPETQRWVAEQNKVTQQFLAACTAKEPLEARLKEVHIHAHTHTSHNTTISLPFDAHSFAHHRPSIQSRCCTCPVPPIMALTASSCTSSFDSLSSHQVYNYERFSCPFRKGDWVFYFHNSGLQNQSVLFKQRGLNAKEEILIDPNTLAEDGTSALGTYDISEDGRMIAYGVNVSGSDWTTIRVRSIDTNEDLTDKIEWVKFSGIAWTHDSKGFFYSRYPQPTAFANATPEQEADPDFKRGTETASVKNHMVYYHRIGTPQSEDQLVFSRPDQPEWTIGAHVSEDGAYLLLTMSESCDTKNRLYVTKLGLGGSYDPSIMSSLIKLVDRFEATFEYVDNVDTLFYFRTNHSAGRYRLIAFDMMVEDIGSKPEEWSTIIPEHEKDVLDSIAIVNQNQFIVTVARDVKQIISLYDRKGTLLVPEFVLPDIGSISSVTARKSDSSFFFSFSSFLYPGVIYSVNLLESDLTKQSTIFRKIVLPGFDSNLFTTHQVFYPSKDGTKIPMFIVHKKDMRLDGSNPTWLYGYGGFNISLQPTFSVARIVFMQHFNGFNTHTRARDCTRHTHTYHA